MKYECGVAVYRPYFLKSINRLITKLNFTGYCPKLSKLEFEIKPSAKDSNDVKKKEFFDKKLRFDIWSLI